MSDLSKSNDLKIGHSLWIKVTTLLGIIFLLLPLLIVVIYSFNSSKIITSWGSFSFKWYYVAFADTELWMAIKNSIIIALINTFISTIFGTMAALALGKYIFKFKKLLQNLLYIPIILPEIIFGIALLSMFSLVNMPFGIITITFAHITFSISFVAVIVLTKIINLDQNLENASQDLGANKWQTLIKVILPAISPGIISGALFAFTLSIDDFVITFFTAGLGSSTLPLKIYSLIKFGVTPEINAISTVLIIFTISAILIAGVIQRAKSYFKGMKYIVATIVFVLVGFVAYSSISFKDERKLNILFYSDYLDNGIIEDFEKEYGIDVVIDYFSSDEELLTKLKMGSADYDIVVPVAFMVKILSEQGLLYPINFDKIPNKKYIDKRFLNLYYDKEQEYSIPYAYGFTGFGYNSEFVKEKVDSWQVLWDPKYKGKISMLDDMKYAFSIAYQILGKQLSIENAEYLDEALELLIKQKPLLKKYESNLTKQLLLNKEVYFAVTWGGEMFKLNREHPEFKFVIPKEGGFIFIDNLSIPKNARNKEEAEIFLNYLLKPDISARNMNYILYAMPNPEAVKLLPEEIRNNEIMFPKVEDIGKMDQSKDLGKFTEELDRAWTILKNK